MPGPPRASARVFLDPDLQFGVGAGQFAGTFRHPAFEVRVEPFERAVSRQSTTNTLNLARISSGTSGTGRQSTATAASPIRIGQVDGRDKDDRGPLVARVFADQRRKLEAIEVGHRYVSQGNGDFLVQPVLQRFARGAGLDQIFAEFGKDALVIPPPL